MLKAFDIFKRAREKPKEQSYRQIPFSLALCKRKREEERFAKYHVTKEKFFKLQ